MENIRKGSVLPLKTQQDALRRFVHRFTKEHVPEWARSNPNYKPQFASDADWLEHTMFYVTKAGNLDNRYTSCMSVPTWPEGKGVNGQKGIDW